MTVAIAWERYVAVHYPLDYNQAVNDANAIRKRLLKYVGPAFFIAVGFNAVKFFEAKVIRTDLKTDCNSKPTPIPSSSFESTYLLGKPIVLRKRISILFNSILFFFTHLD